MIHTLLAVVFIAIYMPLAALIGFPWTLITGNANFLYRLAMFGTRTAVRAAGIRVAVEGLEKLDLARTYIFMCNHVSNTDPAVVIPAIPGRTSVLVKKQLFRIPILGRAMRMGSLVAVDRANRESAIASVAEAAEVLRSGVHMAIFPEGTRSQNGELLPLKKGPFYLAMDAGIPVVPVTVAGTREIMPKGRISIHPGVARVIFHAPIEPAQAGSREALMDAVKSSIASALPKQVEAAPVA